MKRKSIIITGYLILAVTVCSAQSKLFKNLPFGISGGYTDCRTFTPEIFVQKNLTLSCPDISLQKDG
jgi:hypothetical protein